MARILIVEDDPSIALALRDDLEIEGYEVQVVEDGPTALSAARESAFDLILLDVMIPGKDGFEVCRELRADGKTTAIIMLTARSQESDMVMGLELGADDYIVKPYRPRELRARIRANLRRTAEEPQPTRQLGDMEIDFARFEVRRADVSLGLTPIEFKLLGALLRNSGTVMSRDRLLDDVWGPNTYITSRAVDTHMGNLRKKIEVDPARPRYLKSVRGLGYLLEP